MPVAGRIFLTPARAAEQPRNSKGRFLKLPLPRGTAPKPRHELFYRQRVQRRSGRILGRKFYFHHENVAQTLALYRCEMPVEAVTCPFTFQVGFHNLSPDELDLLVYVLELEKGLAHHFGYGKAFGLGSAKLTITHAAVDGPGMGNPRDRFLTYDGPGELAEVTGPLRERIDEGRARVAGEWGRRAPEAYRAFRALFTCPGATIYQYPPYKWFDSKAGRTIPLRAYQQGTRALRPAGSGTNNPGDTNPGPAIEAEPPPGRHRGRVKFFQPRRGFGFIERQGGPDIFVHISNVSGESRLSEGDEVEFTIGPGRQGPQALDVRVLERGGEQS